MRACARLIRGPIKRRARSTREQVDDLIGYLADDLPEGHPFAGVHAGPTPGRVPDIWLLGSAADSAMLAADRGLPFSFAHFFGTASEHAPAVLEAYRKRFRSSVRYESPRPHLALQVLCAESAEEAEYLATSVEVGRLQAARGVRQGLGTLPPEEASAQALSPAEEAFMASFRRAHIVGDPTRVCERILDVAKRCAVEELALVTICYDAEARRRSYELVARGLGLA